MALSYLLREALRLSSHLGSQKRSRPNSSCTAISDTITAKTLGSPGMPDSGDSTSRPGTSNSAPKLRSSVA